MKAKDVADCAVQLGRHKLDVVEAEYIWHAIIEQYEGVPSVPRDVLTKLNWVTIAIKAEEYSNMTLSDIDLVANFGKDYSLNDDQLSAIASRVREDFGNKEPEDYTVYDLTALRQILCAFNRSEIERIHPSAYKEAASVIGKLKRCPPEVLQGFAALATEKTAFGPTSSWTNSTIEALGSVAEYFPKDLITKIRNRKEM
ncbi:uncharacterized protein LOC121738391 [Aricia agestis]|uniref:uncharacterized protein LOC121738391 n=1 Tax=Aricia agestis TaxID=91739 RepID=UPI001C206F73|nr:uncharacterized protein LOC121738391 [Aricia agestis]